MKTRLTTYAFIATLTFCFHSKAGAERSALDAKTPPPETSEELADRVLNTNWHMYYRHKGKSYNLVLRFEKSGVVSILQDAREWSDDKVLITRGYKIRGPINIQFGDWNWLLTFDEDIESFTGTCAKHKGTRCRGTLLPSESE